MPKKKPVNPFKRQGRAGGPQPAPNATALTRRAAESALPADLKFDPEDRLGKGANNVVYKGSFGGTTVALRLPVRGSDTQSYDRAAKEAALMLKAATLHAGPKIIDLWYVKHANSEIRSGLGAVMELLDLELHKVLAGREPGLAAQAAEGCLRCVNSLASAGVILTDLKPQNVMVRAAMRGGAPSVRIIDFGSEFAEATFPPFKPYETPLLGFIAELVDDARLRQHLMATSMLVQLSATTAREMHLRFQDKQRKPTPTPVNALAAATATHLASMRLTNVANVRRILRRDQFKSVLRHYSGRENSGTGRTLRFARGVMKKT